MRRNALDFFGPFGTEDGGVLSVNQPEMSLEPGPQGDTSILTTMRCESPMSARCDGWCRYDLTPRATVVSGHYISEITLMRLRGAGVFVRVRRCAARLGRSPGVFDGHVMRNP